MFDAAERQYLEEARVGRLATADAAGRPHAVPVCYALVETASEAQESTAVDQRIVTPLDEKPKRGDPGELRRSRDIRENATVCLVVDHYTENWADLGWVQVRGRASLRHPETAGHESAVRALRAKYEQYETHDLEARPVIRIVPGSVVSWGSVGGESQ